MTGCLSSNSGDNLTNNADEGTGEIGGLVYLQGVNNHSGIKVKLKEENLISTTDVSGNYQFVNLAAGDYTLEFAKDGYQSVTKYVEVAEGITTEVTAFTLYPTAAATANPIKAQFTKNGQYFDFETGQIT